MFTKTLAIYAAILSTVTAILRLNEYLHTRKKKGSKKIKSSQLMCVITLFICMRKMSKNAAHTLLFKLRI